MTPMIVHIYGRTFEAIHHPETNSIYLRPMDLGWGLVLSLSPAPLSVRL